METFLSLFSSAYMLQAGLRVKILPKMHTSLFSPPLFPLQFTRNVSNVPWLVVLTAPSLIWSRLTKKAGDPRR